MLPAGHSTFVKGLLRCKQGTTRLLKVLLLALLGFYWFSFVFKAAGGLCKQPHEQRAAQPRTWCGVACLPGRPALPVCEAYTCCLCVSTQIHVLARRRYLVVVVVVVVIIIVAVAAAVVVVVAN